MPTYYCESGREIVKVPDDAVGDCSHSGPCDKDVAFWLDRVEWLADDDILRKMLDGYGAWEDLIKASTETLRERALWIACCDIAEEPEVYAD